MKKGEVAMLTCKSEYAYGKRGSPPKIPGDATLIFEITLISWQVEDISKAKDGGILRKIIETGDGGYQTPNDGAIVEGNVEYNLCNEQGHTGLSIFTLQHLPNFNSYHNLCFQFI